MAGRRTSRSQTRRLRLSAVEQASMQAFAENQLDRAMQEQATTRSTLETVTTRKSFTASEWQLRRQQLGAYADRDPVDNFVPVTNSPPIGPTNSQHQQQQRQQRPPLQQCPEVVMGAGAAASERANGTSPRTAGAQHVGKPSAASMPQRRKSRPEPLRSDDDDEDEDENDEEHGGQSQGQQHAGEDAPRTATASNVFRDLPSLLSDDDEAEPTVPSATATTTATTATKNKGSSSSRRPSVAGARGDSGSAGEGNAHVTPRRRRRQRRTTGSGVLDFFSPPRSATLTNGNTTPFSTPAAGREDSHGDMDSTRQAEEASSSRSSPMVFRLLGLPFRIVSVACFLWTIALIWIDLKTIHLLRTLLLAVRSFVLYPVRDVQTCSRVVWTFAATFAAVIAAALLLTGGAGVGGLLPATWRLLPAGGGAHSAASANETAVVLLNALTQEGLIGAREDGNASRRLAALNASLAGLHTQLDTIHKAVAAHRTDCPDVEVDTDAISTAVNDAVEGIGRDCRSASSSALDVQSGQAALVAAVEALRAELNALTASAAGQPSPQPSWSSEDEEKQQRLSEQVLSSVSAMEQSLAQLLERLATTTNAAGGGASEQRRASGIPSAPADGEDEIGQSEAQQRFSVRWVEVSCRVPESDSASTSNDGGGTSSILSSFWKTHTDPRVDRTPHAMLKPSLQPGHCWRFAGSSSEAYFEFDVDVLLSGIYVTHIPRSHPRVTPSDIECAPRDISVSVTDDPRTTAENGDNAAGSGTDAVVIKGAFDPNKGRMFFPVEEGLEHVILKPTRFVKFAVSSNHGHPDYTCVYGIRFAGSPVM